MLCLDTLIVLCDLDVTKDQFRKFVYKELNIYFRSDFQTLKKGNPVTLVRNCPILE